MTLRPLNNKDWSFESLCFVCDPDNERGLQVPFLLDSERGRVVAELRLAKPYSGAPNYVHGGAVAAVLDEAMGWAVIALLERFGVTRRSEFAYKKPLFIDQAYKVEAWIDGQDGRKVAARAEILDDSGEVMTEAFGDYRVMTPESARQAMGDLSGKDTTYVQE